MKKETMLEAFDRLDRRLPEARAICPTRIIIGGGAAMAVAYHLNVSTEDIDGVPDRSSIDFSAFKREVYAVGKELGIAPDWLNDYFSTFLFVLPKDYGERLVPIYQGKNLQVSALGIEELILMKCFAGREKDIPHIRALLRKKPALKIINARLQELLEKNIPGAERAADLFDDLRDEMGLSV